MPCPICGSNAVVSTVRRTHDGREAHHVPCERCGPYSPTEEAVEHLPGALRGDPELIARVAHSVRRMQREIRPPVITTDLIDRFTHTPLPSVFEQADNLIVWIGKQALGPGERVHLDAHRDLFIVGAKSPEGFDFLVSHLEATEYIGGSRAMGGHAHMTLTFRGWEHFDNLQRGQVEGRKAFIAMQYGDPILDRLVDTVFRLAVKQTGFALVRLDDASPAGLIDDRLRVEIRASRFLIADLTHKNLGAYWEAGYAEGLGKPVIYTCEDGVFKRDKTHFDTNHHLTVTWDEGSPNRVAEQLKATIRATLPDVAKLED